MCHTFCRWTGQGSLPTNKYILLHIGLSIMEMIKQWEWGRGRGSWREVCTSMLLNVMARVGFWTDRGELWISGRKAVSTGRNSGEWQDRGRAKEQCEDWVAAPIKTEAQEHMWLTLWITKDHMIIAKTWVYALSMINSGIIWLIFKRTVSLLCGEETKRGKKRGKIREII